jgi:xanthine/uracil permease
MSRWFDRLIPPPLTQRREKPEEVLYGINERPPLGVMLSVGVQHVLLALMLGIYGVIAGQGIGLDGEELAGYLGTLMFILGIGTVLQAIRSRLTPGLLFVFIPNPIALGAYVAVVLQFGLGAAMGAILVSSIAIIAMARVLPRLRPLFPPEVIGVVVLMLGVTLITAGMTRSVGTGLGEEASSGAIFVALATMACIVALSVWGSNRVRTVAVLIGMVVGIIVAFTVGVTDTVAFDGIADLPYFAVPLPPHGMPMPELVPAAIAVIFLVELFSAMDQFACGLTMDKLNNRRWIRADMPLVSRAVSAYGFTNLLHGLTGTITSGFSSANIGLAHSSGVMSRHVGLLAGSMLCVIAFVPAIPALIVFTPPPVIGAMLVYTAAFMIVAGMDLILSRLLNMKRTFTVGLSLVLGMAVMLLPELVEEAPAWSRTIVESGLTVAALTAVGLNALFRIGIKQREMISLDEPMPAQAAATFLEHHGKTWGARQDVVTRAGIAVGEALEALAAAGVATGPTRLVVTFDEFNLDCRLSYPGRILELGLTQPIDAEAMLDEDDDVAIDAAMKRVSAVLVSRLADEVRSFQGDRTAELRLRFDH